MFQAALKKQLIKKASRFANPSSTQGFTLIELLIVIAILGILAVAVLSAINPVEQINRGRDTGSQSDAEQLLSAIQRFDASQGYLPWQSGAGDVSTSLRVGWRAVNTSWVNDASPTQSVLSVLGPASGGSAEIQTSFITRITGPTYNTLYVYNRGGTGDATYICFQPKSGSFQKQASTRCGQDAASSKLPIDLISETSNGTDTTNYSNVCSSSGVYYCLP